MRDQIHMTALLFGICEVPPFLLYQLLFSSTGAGLTRADRAGRRPSAGRHLFGEQLSAVRWWPMTGESSVTVSRA